MVSGAVVWWIFLKVHTFRVRPGCRASAFSFFEGLLGLQLAEVAAEVKE